MKKELCKPLHVRLKPDVRAVLTDISRHHHITVTQIVDTALRRELIRIMAAEKPLTQDYKTWKNKNAAS